MKKLTFPILALVLGFIGLEVFSFALTKLFSVQDRQPIPYFNLAQGRDFELRWRAHPYFGPVYNESSQRRPGEINNFGFSEKFAFPYERKADQEMVIGFFGGSVADQLVHNELVRSLMERKLAKAWSRPVTILNFSMEAGRQPMQFHRSVYFADSYDLAINLDGVNEILNFDTFAPIDYPWGHRLLYPENPLVASHDIFITQIWLELNRKIGAIPAWLYEHSAFVRLGRNLLLGLSQKRAYSSSFFFPQPSTVAHNSKHSDGPKRWRHFVVAQSSALHALGKPSIFLIQPIPYFHKPLSNQEKSLIENDKFGLNKPLIEHFGDYENIQKTLPPSIHWTDLSKLFSENRETLYIDSCCHLNQAGLDLLGDAVVKVILKKYPKFGRAKNVD